MERLGLWGEGTPSFASFPDFLEAVGGRGVGALELVAMDMKARGMFVCRTLSFKGAWSCYLAPDLAHCCMRELVDVLKYNLTGRAVRDVQSFPLFAVLWPVRQKTGEDAHLLQPSSRNSFTSKGIAGAK